MSLQDFAEMMDNDYLGQESKAGVNVNEHNAFKSSAVYACVRILSFSVASLPLFVYRDIERGKEKAKGHPLYKMLHDQPNPEMTSFNYFASQMAHTTTWGNAYSEIETDRNGNPQNLWPIPPWRVKVMRTGKGKLFYRVKLEKEFKPGQKTEKGKYIDIPARYMKHDMGLTTNGRQGLSVIGAAREAIGLDVAAEEYGARFFSSGTNVGGFVSHPEKLKNDTFQRLKKDMSQKYAGLGKSHRLMFLDEGMKYERVGIPPEDAQFLQTRKFQLQDIARFYNVPLHLLQEHENSTTWGSGLEELNLGFVIYSLRPYLVSIEQEMKRKLFANDNNYFAEFSVEGLLRGDTSSRADFYSRLFQMAAISPNEIRAYENKNPYEGGDEYYIQLNMVPVKEALSEPEIDDIQNSRSLEQRKKKLKRIKSKRAASTRHRIAKSYEKVFQQASRRIFKREKADIMRKAEKIFDNQHSRSGSPSQVLLFEDFIEEFYESHKEYINRQIMPALTSLAEAIQSEVAVEIDGEEGLSDDLRDFIRKYEEAYATRHIAQSEYQLKTTVEQALEDDEDIIPALGTRFEEMVEQKPAQEAITETVKLSNAITKMSFAYAGIRYLRWIAIGDETCEFCQELDGKIVGTDQNFVEEDDYLDAEGREGETMVINKPIGHPPLHSYCQCQIAAD